MKKIIEFLKNKITCEIYLIISLVLIILGSALPFQTAGAQKEKSFIFIESNYKIICICAIILIMSALVLAFLGKTKILSWYIFLVSFFVAVCCFFLYVESLRQHYAEGKTAYAIGTYLYSIGTLILMAFGMYSLAKGVKTFRS